MRCYQKRQTLGLILIICLMFVASHTHLYANENCQFEQVTFTSDFQAGRLDGCEQLSPNRFLLISKPENEKINPSPWYAFKVQSKKKHSDIEVVLRAQNARSRYLPKMLDTDGQWVPLNFSLIDGDIVFSVKHTLQPILIAAQPLIDNDYYQKWMAELVNKGIFTKIQLGTSEQNRIIEAMVARQNDNNEWLVLIGRQHPPELTGAQAMIHFVNALHKKDDLLARFYSRFNVLIVPNLNPDGVALGNWRHNTNGIDLNRDWGKFTQKETRLVGDYMNELFKPCEEPCKQQKLVFALDFHSTQQNIFYTMPNDYDVAPNDLADAWLDRLKMHTMSSFVIRNRPGSSPGRGVFKQYIADTYNVHAITYEMGDNTNAQMIKHVAEASVSSLAQELLSRAPQEFTYQTPEIQ